MAKTRDEEYNFCNKIVILNTECFLTVFGARLLQQTCCTSCSQHARVTGGHRRLFSSLSEPL